MSSDVYGDRESTTKGSFSDIDKAASTMRRDIDSLKSDHKDADTRIILHAKEASDIGLMSYVVRIQMCLYCKHFFANELCQEIWMQTGNFKYPKFIKVHEIYIQNIMPESLVGFHSITGCDTISHFRGYGEKKSWKVFEKHSELLKNLGVGSLTEETIFSAEQFVCKMYAEYSDITSVNELRCQLFRQGRVEPEKLPPAKRHVDSTYPWS